MANTDEVSDTTTRTSGLRFLADRPYIRSSYFDQFMSSYSNGTTHERYYDTSHKDLRATPMYGSNSNSFCVYCGSYGHQIQGGLRLPHKRQFYDVTGYYCDCEDAAKFLQVEDKLAILTAEFEERKREIEKDLPRVNHNIEYIAKAGYSVIQIVRSLYKDSVSKKKTS